MGRTGYDTTGLYLDRLKAPRNASGGKKAVDDTPSRHEIESFGLDCIKTRGMVKTESRLLGKAWKSIAPAQDNS
ncbi:hypothetical protein CGLO_03712 [Colletotrichum gloeosporioides Cg-14]|uniref:Uncharacterized protein n=1 Tax=Colletotrichum gloeosporioides (strain Cg-14) TaxID=1237896 RepID=T0M607_COLGC|nr:hypothetical protein CGLO_03712 [Colletotrichum gloeosporioides Cg-14]